MCNSVGGVIASDRRKIYADGRSRVVLDGWRNFGLSVRCYRNV